jgi:lipooligosaccharide transport system permease protein
MRNALVWRRFLLSSLVGNLGQPVLFLLAFGLGFGPQGGAPPGVTYLQFIAPGLAMSAVMYSAAFEATYGSYTRLATQSTFEGILMTPVSVEALALGEILWGGFKGFVSGAIMVACLPLFGLWPSPWAAGLLPLLFLAGILFAALGLAMTALASNYEFFNYFLSLFITPLYLFSGVFFRLDALSGWARPLAEALPLTPYVTLARMFCDGRFDSPVLPPLASALCVAAGATAGGILLLRRRMIQ